MCEEKLCGAARETIPVSTLGKTWILDLDGTLVKHNGYRLDGKDTLLAGAEKLLRAIRPEDLVIIVTSRSRDVAAETESFLREKGIRYDAILYGAPYGERILVNDRKPSGLATAIAINVARDAADVPEFVQDERL